MASPDLPPDLAAFEQQLLARERPAPEPVLRQRVLETLRQELHPPTPPGSSFWWTLAATAAGVLLWINFSMSVINNMDWHFAGRPNPAQVEETAERICALLPELPETEVYRQALLLQPATRPAPGPNPSAALDSLVRRKEQQQWVTH